MSNPSNRASMRGQLTLRGVVIGVLGCVIITASSAYTALKMGALPWPIIFAAVISLFFLKLMGNASLNEANVTHTIMSAGAMVAGGLGLPVLSSFSLVGYEGQVRVLQLEKPIALRLGAAVKSVNTIGTSARMFLTFLREYYGKDDTQ